MPVRIKRKANIINIPVDFAKLVSIDRRGFFRYVISYQVNINKALREQTNLVEINFLENTPSLSKHSRFNAGNSPSVVIDNIRLYESKQRNMLRNNLKKIFFSKTSDFTRVIKKEVNISLATTKEYARKSKKRLVSISGDANKQGIVKPVLIQNRASSLDSKTSKQKQDTKTLTHVLSGRKEKSFYSTGLMNFSIEPAAYLGKKTQNILSSKSGRKGTITKLDSKKNKKMMKGKVSEATAGLVDFKQSSKGLQRNRFMKKSISKTKVPAQMKSKILSIQNKKRLINNINPTHTKNLDPDKMYVEIVNTESSFETIREIVDIPFGALHASTFALQFKVLDKKGFDVQRISKQVDHANFVSQFELPKEAPTLDAPAFTTSNKVVLELEQVDENAVGVALYKRIVPVDEVVTNSKFDLVQRIPLTVEQGKIYYYDYIASTNPCIYRAMAYDAKRNLTGEFASAVVLYKNKIGNNKLSSFRKKQSFCSLTHKITEEGIRLEIRNVSPGASALYVERKDLTAKSNSYVRLGGTILVTESSELITLVDPDAKNDRIYEYRCVLIYEDGVTEVANNNLILEFNRAQTNVVNLLVSEPELTKNSQVIDVKMTLQKDIILNDHDVIKNFLSEQGLDEQYIDEIYNSREKLQNLFFTRIVRQNLATGEEEDFGALKTNDFSDFKLGKVKNVKPLESGGMYRYVFYTHARSTETMLDSVVRTVEQTNVSTTIKKKDNSIFNPSEYSYSPAKWRHPVVLKHGNLVTNDTLKKNYSKNEFTLGTLVDITYVDVSLNESRPNIVKVNATVLDEYSNILTWEVDGNTEKIDHFIVSVEISGIKDIVGKVHNIDNNGRYIFIDTLDNDEEGALIYYVTPVYFDMNFGPAESSNVVII